ncbi:MAG TPA: hypothetical protein VIW94_06425, partial [Acidimicrobiia bacterium]
RRHSISHVMVATRLGIIGTSLFMVTIASVVYLVSAILAGELFAAIATASAVLLAAWSWFYLPLVGFDEE